KGIGPREVCRLIRWQLMNGGVGGYTITVVERPSNQPRHRRGWTLTSAGLSRQCRATKCEGTKMRYAPLCQPTRRGILAGAIATPFLASRLANAAEPAGKVEALRGEATAQSGSEIRPLAPDASV